MKYAFFVFLLLGLPQIIYTEEASKTPPLGELKTQNDEIIKLLREIRGALVEFQVERRTQQEKPQRIVDPDSCVLIDGSYAQTHFYICWGTQYKHWP